MNLRQRGQALVETALVAPIVLLLMLAMIDGGMVLRDQVSLQEAARQGARIAATEYSPNVTASQISAAVVAATDLQVVNNPTNIVVTSDSSGNVTVRVLYQHELWTPVMRRLWGGGTGMVADAHGDYTFVVPDHPDGLIKLGADYFDPHVI